MTSFPPNFIPIVDAFDQAVATLAPAEIAGPAKDPNDLGNAELAEFEDEFAEFFQQKDEAGRKVERLFRDALADGLIGAWVKDGGRMEVLFDRESWRPMAVGVPGFEARTHHLTNPGPNDERPVFIERGQFETWLRMTAGFAAPSRRGRKPAFDWGAIEIQLHEKCRKNGGVPSPEVGIDWAVQADAERFVMDLTDQNASEKTVRDHTKQMLARYKG